MILDTKLLIGMILQFTRLDMKNNQSEAQARKNMIVYLKNQSNYKMKDFEGMSYDEIRPIFEKIWDFNHNFVPMDLEIEKEKKKTAETTTRSSTKKQKVELNDEKEDLKGYLDIVPREDVAVNVDSLSTKYPIVDWKTYTLSENFMYYKIIRGDGSSKNYKILSTNLMILVGRSQKGNPSIKISKLDRSYARGASVVQVTTGLDLGGFTTWQKSHFQVTPKSLHIHAVKRIFKYLKGQPKLGLWYLKDSPFDLEAYMDSGYVGANYKKQIVNGIEVKAGDPKLMLLGINLLLLVKVNAARHELTTVGKR
ncbi:hypothetical protein Tco_0918517 [Tanacetum coccineum]